MTFLQLCQRVAQESGTVAGSLQPSTVIGQTGRLAKFVNWTASAWSDIQLRRSDWLWMEGEFSGETASGTATYAPGGAEFNLTRFGEWKPRRYAGGDSDITIYLTASGVSDERALLWLPYETFRRQYLRGGASLVTGYPAYVTIDPAQNLRLHPIPNGAYTVRGRYHKSPQVLAADADVPEMPAKFHQLIAWEALTKFIGPDDEATPQQFAGWERRRSALDFDLTVSQTPPTSFAESWV